MVRGNNNHTCSPSFSNASSRPACKWSPPPLSASVGNAIPRISSTGTGELAHETLEAVRELFGQWEDGKSDAERADGVRVAARKCNSSARASALDSRVFISLVQSSASPHLLTGRHIQVSVRCPRTASFTQHLTFAASFGCGLSASHHVHLAWNPAPTPPIYTTTRGIQ